jgi:ribosome biogenesis protein ERB1
VVWHDLDLGEKPYKTLQYHEKAVTGADFHGEYPLMASCSTDGTIQIFHAKVSSEDLMQDAVILPLKVLRGHTVKGLNGVSGVKFHPKQPWVFSIGHDGKVFMWT